jgi:hypothetical protein
MSGGALRATFVISRSRLRHIWKFELHPAWNMEPSERRVSGSSAGNAVRMWQRWCRRTQKESVMGLGKKAKREAKAVKGKTKKDARKVKHKGKKAKNAAKH